MMTFIEVVPSEVDVRDTVDVKIVVFKTEGLVITMVVFGVSVKIPLGVVVCGDFVYV